MQDDKDMQKEKVIENNALVVTWNEYIKINGIPADNDLIGLCVTLDEKQLIEPGSKQMFGVVISASNNEALVDCKSLGKYKVTYDNLRFLTDLEGSVYYEKR